MTGGTWANAGELLGVTGGPDDGPAMSVAERPTRRHDLGRHVDPNPTTPAKLVQPAVRVLPAGQPCLSSLDSSTEN